MATFGELLAELRRDRGMKQGELAKLLNVSSSTISNYETGTQIPPMERIITIADIFHVTTDYLLGRCPSQLSPDVMEKEALPGQTVGQVIQDIESLSPERKMALAIVLGDMKRWSTIMREAQ